MEEEAVKHLREYVSIKSVHPNPDYASCVTFLTKLAKRANLPIKVFNVGEKKNPVVVITCEGKEKKLPSILLNSHMDVVPVQKEKWTHDPFEGFKDTDGKIYGRGTQDMKSVGMQHLEAIKRLTEQGFKPKRTVHLSFVPDEEIGGINGMAAFVKTNDFKSLNVGFALDESCGVPTDYFIAFFAERLNCSFAIKCTGPTGHGSLLHKNTAGEKLRVVLDEIFDFRDAEVKKLASVIPAGSENKELLALMALGEFTSVNLTILDGGVQNNVVPPEMRAEFDCRLAINKKKDEFQNFLQSVCEKAGNGVSFEFLSNEPIAPATEFEKDPFCVAMFQALKTKGWNTKVIGCAGCTDARFLRYAGVPSIGFSPIRHCEIKLHADNEFIPEKSYLEGISTFMDVIKAVTEV